MRNDAIRQSLSHDPAKAIPFVLHSITTTSSASLLSHQRLPHLSLPPLTCLPPHPSFSSPISFLRLLLSFACFPSPAFLRLLSFACFPLPIAFLTCLLPRTSLALPVSCLTCLLPRPSLALHISGLTPIFPHLLLSFARPLPCPSLTSPVSYLAHLLPHLPLPTCYRFPLPIVFLCLSLASPVSCLTLLFPHVSLLIPMTPPPTRLTLALTRLFLYRQPLHPSSLVHFFPHLSLPLCISSLTCLLPCTSPPSPAASHSSPVFPSPSPINFLAHLSLFCQPPNPSLFCQPP